MPSPPMLQPPMLQPCVVRGCGSLTLAGGTCVVHDPPPREYPRGRPYAPAESLGTPGLSLASLELALGAVREPALR